MPLSEMEDAYDELCAYTLTHGGREFIHQHVVDAHAAQQADERSKPIGVTFALIGLYLHVVKGYTGRQVQQAHMRLAKRKQQWPAFVLPVTRGSITPLEVMKTPAGAARDGAIHAWCASVWEACDGNRSTVEHLLRANGEQI